MNYIHSCSWFTYAEPIHILDNFALHKAEQIFQEYQAKGVILGDCSFGDTKWKLTDEKKTVRFSFDMDNDAFTSNAQAWACCDADTYINAVKTYAAMHLGTRILTTIQGEIRILTQLPEIPLETITASYEHAGSVLEFLRLPDAFERAMCLTPSPRHRTLAPFQDYILFDNSLSMFWKQADTDAKIQYFPLYLWWNLSGILPLRPTEFLLIPRDCLSQTDGKNILTIRRTNLKKGLLKVFYSVELDYKKVAYEIPQSLAEEIRAYLDETKQMTQPSVDSLFVPACKQAYLTYSAANTLLHAFTAEHIGENCEIHLGDTRHLSMISLILSGNSAEMCKRLADQENVLVSANYFTNLGSILEKHFRKQHYAIDFPERWCFFTGRKSEILSQFA